MKLSSSAGVRIFPEGLKEIFGDKLFLLPNEYIDVLNVIYQHNEYSYAAEISARLIGTYLYYKNNRSVDDDARSVGDVKEKKMVYNLNWRDR